MDPALVLSLALSGLIGLALGVFGGGGSILAVPMLVFVTGVAPAAAVGMSLAIVGATSLAASYAHHRRGHVRPKVALLFGGSGVTTAFFGARLTHLISADAVMLSFATLMVLVGAWMLTSTRTARSMGGGTERPAENRAAAGRPRMVHTLWAGATVGGVSGFLGVGGGFLVVPALIGLAGLGPREAIGTSLLVIAINSVAGFVGHLDEESLNLPLMAALTAVAMMGGSLGERVTRSLSLDRLRRGFAAFVIAVGIAVAVATLG